VRELWDAKAKDRQRLVHVVRARLGRQLGFRGADQEAIARAAHAFDPDTLTLGFARRFAAYKRPALLLHDPDRLERLLTRQDRPVQIVIAGKAHPDDAEGAALIAAWVKFAARPAVENRVAFLEDYDLTLAEELVRGVDVWINTPRRPWEACGTSGMKVLANGGLNASTLDGWWAEAYDESLGWRIGGAADSAGSVSDAADATALYELLEREIVPEFYSRDALGIPVRWLERVRASMAELAPRFSANRMVREYARDVYVPAAEMLHDRERENGRAARELCAWHARVTADWSTVHFGTATRDSTEGDRTITVPVYLGALHPSDVAVQLYADAVGDAPSACLTMADAGALPGSATGRLYRAEVAGTRSLSDYTPRVVAAHAGVRIPIEAWPILWYR
jgi:starch phosphorylase